MALRRSFKQLHRAGSVPGSLHLHSCQGEQFRRNLLIQLIIFHKHNMIAAVIPAFPHILMRSLPFFNRHFPQDPKKPALKQGTRNECADACTLRAVFLLCPVFP